MSNIKPNHYLENGCSVKDVPSAVFEPIDYTEYLPHREAAAFEYIIRAGSKIHPGMTRRQSKIEDLKKAQYYLARKVLKPLGEVEEYSNQQTKILIALAKYCMSENAWMFEDAFEPYQDVFYGVDNCFKDLLKMVTDEIALLEKAEAMEESMKQRQG